MKIMSGGQTGVDRGALDAAIVSGVSHGGWCPKGRRAEDGVISTIYALTETPQPAYLQRTRWNVRDADATLLLHTGEMGPGTKATIGICRELKKPHLVVDMRTREALSESIAFVRLHQVTALNVAGPRESNNPGIQERARTFMIAMLNELT